MIHYLLVFISNVIMDICIMFSLNYRVNSQSTKIGTNTVISRSL